MLRSAIAACVVGVALCAVMWSGCGSTETSTETSATVATSSPPSTQTQTTQAATTTAPSATQVVKLTCSNWTPPENALAKAIEKWAADFEAKTGGRYKIEVVHGGAIANGGDAWDAVAQGICDMASMVPKESDRPAPAFNIPLLPISYASCVDASKVWFDLYRAGYFDKDLSDVKVLFTFLGNVEDVSTKNPVTGVAGFKGMKLVAPGGMSVRIAELVGAVPVQGGPPDAYQLVEKGIADGIFIASLGMKEFQWAELVHYLIKPMQFGRTSHVVVMNKSVYDKMPADVKAIVDEMAADPQYGLAVAEGWDAWIGEAYDYFHQKGGQDIDWSQDEKAKLAGLVAPLWKEYLEKNGPDAKAALDAYHAGMKALGYEDPTPGYTP